MPRARRSPPKPATPGKLPAAGGDDEPAGPEPCVFCEILRGEAPAAWVAESDQAVAFLTIGPLRPGHTLVVPRVHAVTLDDADPADWADVMRLALDVALRQRKKLGATGHTLFLASGDAGEQSVRHLHVHVVPRNEDDGLDLTSWWNPKIRKPSVSELDSTARRLRGDAVGA